MAFLLLVGYRNASRITTHNGVIGCVVHLVHTIKDNVGLERSTCTSSSDCEVQSEKPGHGDASGRPRHIHVIQPCPGSQTSRSSSGACPPRTESCWVSSAIIRSSLQGYRQASQPGEGRCHLHQELQRRIIANTHISGALSASEDRNASHMEVDDVSRYGCGRWAVAVGSSELE